jgi:hypothetical protein
LEELTAYEDIFSMDGRTNRVYTIDTGEARTIRHAARRLRLAKQAEADEMLDDMRRRGVIGESRQPLVSQSFLSARRKGTDTERCHKK